MSGFAQQKTITGKVTDAESAEPLPGVTIVVKGTTIGTITNFDGDYSFIAETGQTPGIFVHGYNSQELVILMQNKGSEAPFIAV